jgi:hypothetical protein
VRGSLFRRHYLLPAEHGSWIWWIGPFLIGSAAAGNRSVDLLVLALAALAAFLLRQPASILVKVRAGRRPRQDLRPAAIWAAIDLAALLAVTAALLALGHGRILVLAVPGALVFAWHLALIARREERGQMGIELAGAGVLALTAPAAYWVAGGGELLLPWLLWSLCWLQAAASIVLVYHRLGGRRQARAATGPRRLRQAWRPLAYHIFNVALAALFWLSRAIPGVMALAFGLMLLDAVDGILRPPLGLPPSRIGVRQLLASALFIALSAAGLLGWGE